MKVGLQYLDRRIEFNNCHAVNPATKRDSGHNMIFYVLADGECWPHPITSGPYQNVTAIPFGIPIDSYDKVIGILSKYHANPQQVYWDEFVVPLQI